MRNFKSILYVSHGTTDETEGLKQALSLARNNEAPLNVLVLAPEFPSQFQDFKESYTQENFSKAQGFVNTTMDAINIPQGAIVINMDIASNQMPAAQIIRHVLQKGHDLVVKEVEPNEAPRGFKALDMHLLRKCPVPVWLCHPIGQSRDQIRVGVAIDPETDDQAANDLSRQLLRVSSALAADCSGELQIVSCWDYEFESYLRGSAWIKTSDEEVDQTVKHAEFSHRKLLDGVIASAAIDEGYQIHHLRGRPTDQIPSFVDKEKIDILVMGTLARTGIPGFLIGNTAENVVQKLNCSLMALKPHGFVSPIEAY